MLEEPQHAATSFAMEVVQKECDRLGVTLPADHEHAYNATKLHKEEEEYALADQLLCPSDFVMRTFLDRGYPRRASLHGTSIRISMRGRFIWKTASRVIPKTGIPQSCSSGVCAVRKGVHYALEAWLRSPASKDGTFLIAGEFLPDYKEKLTGMLSHPSVKVLGHREDVAELMRSSDILVLPSIEEGSALVTSEARGSGCVLLVSDACTAICRPHEKCADASRTGDVVSALTQHITMLHEDRALLEQTPRCDVTRPQSQSCKPGPPLGTHSARCILRDDCGSPSGIGAGKQAESGRSVCATMKNPKVSVVIPTYNRAGTVPRAIESVLGQTFTDIEVVVVDDGSSDDTGKVLAEMFGERIRYFAQVNQGASIARNRGIEEARGEWIAFLDSDDLWEKEKLEWQLKAVGQFAPQCFGCYTDTRFFNHPETRTMFQLVEHEFRHEGTMGAKPDVLERLVRPGGAGMVVCLSSFMGRADVIRKTTGFDPKLLYSQDSEFLFRLALLTGFCYVNLPLVRFDRSPAEVRHVGVQAEWNKFEFWLKDSQMRLEGLLRLSEGQPPENPQRNPRAAEHDSPGMDQFVPGNRPVREGARSGEKSSATGFDVQCRSEMAPDLGEP